MTEKELLEQILTASVLALATAMKVQENKNTTNDYVTDAVQFMHRAKPQVLRLLAETQD